MHSKGLLVFSISLISSALSSAHPFGGRIVGGQLANPGQFPYIVSIQEDIEELNHHGHFCGGSILNNQWIVTAGHCIVVEGKENYQIIAGTNLIDTGGVTYNVVKTILHPNYNITAIANDIALIKVDGEFDFTDTVTSIEIGEITGNESSTTLGWGATEYEDTPNGLMFADVIALSTEDCLRLAEGSMYIDVYPPGPAKVCAVGSKGKGPCYGDSGGPLVSNNTLIGITSHLLDAGCGNGYPDMFTRVAYYKEWIESTILAD